MTASTDRVEFRITGELKAELEAAAAMRGLTTSAFVKDAGLRAARESNSSEHQIRLSSEAWEEFSAAINRPGKYVEGFADLLHHSSVFSDDDSEQLDALVEHFGHGNRSEFLRIAIRRLHRDMLSERMQQLQSRAREELAGRQVSREEVTSLVKQTLRDSA